MKQLPHLSSLLYATPWAILPATHAELGALYRAYLTGHLPPPVDPAPRPRSARPDFSAEVPTEGAMSCGGIAWALDRPAGILSLDLRGIVTKRDPMLMCGPPVIALDELDALLRAAAADPSVRTVVLAFDSPGGTSVGLEETAANIRDLAAEKRVVAYTETQMCSAAYWLACGADEIYASPSAIVGSIGVYLAAIDDTRAWELDGLQLKLFRVGKFKAMGMSGKPWTEEEESWLASETEAIGAAFRAWVAERRPDLPAEAMEGQFFFAGRAPVGLLDGLHRDLLTLLEVLRADRPPTLLGQSAPAAV